MGPKDVIYPVNGQPMLKYRIGHPTVLADPNTTPTALDQLTILKYVDGSLSAQFAYAWDDTNQIWTLDSTDEQPVAVRLDDIVHTSQGPNDRTERHTVKEPNTAPAYVEDRLFHSYEWGEEEAQTIIDPGSANLTRTTTRYENANEFGRYGRVFSVVNSDGSWIVYDYDTSGRTTLEIRPWLDENEGITTTPADAHATYYYYDVHSGDSADSRDARKPRTMQEKILNRLVRQTYWTYVRSGTPPNDVRTEIEEQCVSLSGSPGDTSNLKTQTTYDRYDRLTQILYPDGRVDVYTYDNCDWSDNNGDPPTAGYTLNTSGSFLLKTVEHRGTSGSAVAGKSTTDIAVVNITGHIVFEQTLVFAGGSSWPEISSTVYRLDNHGHVLQVLSSDNTRQYASWSCCKPDWEVDETGIMTEYLSLDALGRVLTKRKAGVDQSGNFPAQPAITTTYTYDALGHVLTQSTTGGTNTLSSSNSYDLAGRLSSSTDSAGLTTSYDYDVSSAGRVETITRPSPQSSAETEIRTYFPDGRLKSITGTAVVHSFYTHGVNEQDGTQWTQVNQGSPTSELWTRTTTDAVGRTILEERPGYASSTVTTAYDYIPGNNANAGKLLNATPSHMAATFYVYDDMGRVSQTGLDLDDSDTLTTNSADRITETSTGYSNTVDQSGDWYLVTESKTYATNGSSTPTPTGATMQQLTGLEAPMTSRTISQDASGNQTTVTRTFNTTTLAETHTRDVPGSNTDEVSINRNGLLQSHQSSTGVVTTFGYDDLGRQASVKNPRHTEPSTTDYDPDTGQMTLTTDAAGNETTYTYDPDTGRLASTTNHLEKTQYFAYTQRGELKRTWGHTPYPVEYDYDDFGRRTKLRTFQTGNDWDDPDWSTAVSGNDPDETTWNYEPATGYLLSKVYADENGTTYTYTPDGRVAERTWTRENASSQPVTTTYEYYDDISEPRSGALQSITYNDDTPAVTYEYDRLGRIARVRDVVSGPNDWRTFSYRSDLQLDTENIDAGQAGLYSKLISRLYQDGQGGTLPGRVRGFQIGDSGDPDADYETTYTYASNGRMYAITGPGLPSGIVTYDYWADSDLVKWIAYRVGQVDPQIRTTLTYENDRDLLESVEHVRDPNGTPATLSKYDYANDELGRRASVTMTGSAFTNFGDDHHWRWGYNERSELTQSDRCETTTLTGECSLIDYESTAYEYDPIGNRVTTLSEVTPPISWEVNELNQYTEVTDNDLVFEDFAYDDDGNMTHHWSAGPPVVYKWDAENRLIEVAPSGWEGAKKVLFDYDYMSRRVRKQVFEWDGVAEDWEEEPASDLRFVYDGWNVVLALDGLDDNEIVTKYTWGLDLSGQRGEPTPSGIHGAGGIGGLLAAQEMAGTYAGSYWFHYDANGNVGQIIQNTTNYPLVAHYGYDGYGNSVTATGTYASHNPFRFSTKWRDAETGLYYNDHRYYTPSFGRWLSRDPIDEPGAALLQHAAAVTSLSGSIIPLIPVALDVHHEDENNLYTYANNQPPHQIDVLGLKACRLDPAYESSCCTCLLYAEAGGSPGCLSAYAWVMLNRQRTDWPDFRREKSFCEQAATGPASGRVTWAGGEGFHRYENCCVCLNNAIKDPKECPECDINGDEKKCCPLSNAEAEAALRASYMCNRVRRGEVQDPTGGAQYVGTRGAVTNAVGAHNIPTPCRLFQAPGCSSWFAKCSRRPLGK